MVGNLRGTQDMFDRGGFTGTESHFGIGGIWGSDQAAGLDGALWQFQDLDHTADANYEGSWHIISIETADNAPQRPEQILPWTPRQVARLVDTIVELCDMYSIPPTLIPDTKRGRRGLAYHYQGVPPNLVEGGERWSKAGHVCPGPVRVKQYTSEVIPKVQAVLLGTQPQGVNDMDWDTLIPLTETDAKYFNVDTSTGKAVVNPSTGKPYVAGDKVHFADMVKYPTGVRKMLAEQRELDAKLDQLLERKPNGS